MMVQPHTNGQNRMVQTGIRLRYRKKGGFICMATLILMTGLILTNVQADNRKMLEFAMSLFKENNFRSCRIECLRTLSENPLDKQVQFYLALSERRIGIDSTESFISLCSDKEVSYQIKDMACYELSRAYIDKKKYFPAFEVLKQLFIDTKLPSLFIRSSCSLSHLFDHEIKLTTNNPELYCQVDSCFSLWSDQIIEETSLNSQHNKKSVLWSGLPAQWVILLYQTQIGPAIGQRCSLLPSCSRYAQQALKKYGIWGIGFIGDRMIREPDVVAQKLKPEIIDGRVKYHDPLNEHDFINNYK